MRSGATASAPKSATTASTAGLRDISDDELRPGLVEESAEFAARAAEALHRDPHALQVTAPGPVSAAPHVGDATARIEVKAPRAVKVLALTPGGN